MLPIRRVGAYAYRAVRLASGPVLITSEEAAVTWIEGGDTVETGPMQVARMQGALVALPDGRGLAIGGRHDWKEPVLSTCELFDPANRAWRPAPSLNHARGNHASVFVGDRVLVMGGEGLDGRPLASVEAWRPGDDEWAVLSPMKIARARPKAVVLKNGNVLVADGGVEIWKAKSETWSLSKDGPARTEVAVVARKAGGAVVLGGREGGKDVKTVDVLSGKGAWSRGADLPDPRYEHGAIEMPDGTIVITGGSGTRREPEDSSTGGELDHEYRSFPITGWSDRVVSLDDSLMGTPDTKWTHRFGMEFGSPLITRFDDTRILIAGYGRCALWKVG